MNCFDSKSDKVIGGSAFSCYSFDITKDYNEIEFSVKQCPNVDQICDVLGVSDRSRDFKNIVNINRRFDKGDFQEVVFQLFNGALKSTYKIPYSTKTEQLCTY